jgi:predicted Zn-dependent peptidase
LISSLTVADLQRAAAAYLRTDNYVRVSLFPETYPGAQPK